MAIALQDPEEPRLTPERAPRILHLPKLKARFGVQPKSNYDHCMSEWPILIPLVVPVVTKMPILTLVRHEHSIGVELKFLGYLHRRHYGVPVQQDVLDVPLSVLVPGSHHAAQHN